MTTKTDAQLRTDDTESSDESDGSIWEDHETAWRYLERSDASGGLPVFFEHVRVSQDGGVSLITGTKDANTDMLWHFSRYFSALSVWASCILNTHYIAHVFHKVTAKEDKADNHHDFLIINSIRDGVKSMLGGEYRSEYDPFVLLSSLEVIMLAVLWLRLIYSTIVICSSTGWKRWDKVQSVFFEQLGTLSVFSSMQLLFYITPKVFVANLMSKLTGRQHPDYCGALTHFLFGILCFIIGFDAFLVKFRLAAHHFIYDKHELTLDRFYGSAMLLNQILGVMQLTWIVRTRVYRFVFTGPSNIFSDEAMVKMDTWNSWVSMQIWRKYKNVVDRLAMLTTFSDEDFQLLLLSDEKED